MLSYLYDSRIIIYKSSHEYTIIMLFQDLSWPKAHPLFNLLLVVKLPNSAIKAIYFIAFLLVILPVYDHPSPSGAKIILVEFQYHRVCHQLETCKQNLKKNVRPTTCLQCTGTCQHVIGGSYNFLFLVAGVTLITCWHLSASCKEL